MATTRLLMACHVKKYFWYLQLGLFSLVRPLMAQNQPIQFEFRHIQEKDGLSHNIVTSFLQDRNGFLWVGSTSGLNRYDGRQFVVFKRKRNNANSLLNNTVYDLCEDPEGNIWTAVENGISCYEKNTGNFRNIHEVKGRPLQICLNILCDRSGDIWFTGVRQGLFRRVAKSGSIERYSAKKEEILEGGLNRVLKNGMVLDPRQNGIWMATAEGVGYFDIDRKEYFDYTHNPKLLPIFTNHFTSGIALDGNRLIFADNVDKKIIIYDLQKQQIIRTVQPPIINQNEGFEIGSIFADRHHNLWVSSNGYRTFYIEADTYRITELFHNDAQSTSIASTYFWDGWQHPDGSVWLGTVNGISYTNPEQAFYTIYDLKALYPDLVKESGGITRIQEDDDGSWWIGTHIRGLIHYFPKANRLKIHKLPDSPDKFPFGGYVCALLPYKQDLFVLSNIGFSRFNKQTETVQKLPLPPSKVTYTSQKCGVVYDNQIWIGNDDGLIFSYSPETGQWRNYPIDVPPNNPRISVRRLLIDAKGSLWAEVFPFGYTQYDQQKARFRLVAPSRNDNYTVNVAYATDDGIFDREGNLWLTTYGYGLWRYNVAKKTYDNWTESDGLVYDHTQGITYDLLGNIWVGSYNKFSVFTPSKNRFLAFNLPINEANLVYSNVLFRLRNGHIVAGMKGNLVEFAPEKINQRPTRVKEKVLIGQVNVGDTTILIHSGLSKIQLPADNNDFTIQFAALVPPNERHFIYMYRLSDYHDWKTVDGLSGAVYTKMPGGDYTFSVKGVSIDGQETPVNTLQIHIDTPFYRAGWFWTIIGISFMGLVLGFVRYRAQQIAQLHQLQVQATRLERDKSEIQYQNLINHLNPHFLFNSLTSLSSLINIDPREASAFLRKLSVIYRYILQNKDKEVVTLEDELKFVQHYIDLQKSRFDEGLQFEVNIPSHYLPRLIVPVTLQNLLENAIKHNIIDDTSPLVIRIFPDQNHLCVVNNLQKKKFVETSNKQGLASLKSMYYYLSNQHLETLETDTEFIVRVPLL